MTAAPDDRDLWVLPGVGTMRRTGRISRAATAEAGGRSWKIVRFGFIGTTGFRACDETGAVVGELKRPMWGRGETMRWAGRDLSLDFEEPDRNGHVLREGDRRLAVMTPKRRGKRPLDVVIEDPAADPGLLLFTAFIVQAYADDASFPQGPSPPTS